MGPSVHLAAKLDRGLLEALTRVVAQAARVVLSHAGAKARRKSDGSPVTAADEASEALMLGELPRLLPGVPVVSEEQGDAIPKRLRCETLVLADPLDGTREFVAGLPDHTVNLAVVVEGTPMLGIVAAPAFGLLWRGIVGLGAERLRLGKSRAAVPIGVRQWPAQDPVAVVSRSHLDDETAALLAAHPQIRRELCGSSLKFCRLAEGSADFYPRLAPTSEWDNAAGHAILVAAGGLVVRPDGEALRYGRAEMGFRVPAFLAVGDPAAAPRFRAGPA